MLVRTSNILQKYVLSFLIGLAVLEKCRERHFGGISPNNRERDITDSLSLCQRISSVIIGIGSMENYFYRQNRWYYYIYAIVVGHRIQSSPMSCAVSEILFPNVKPNYGHSACLTSDGSFSRTILS